MGWIFFLVMMVISFTVSELLRPQIKGEKAKPQDIGDFTFPTAEEGRVIPYVVGQVSIRASNVIWHGDQRQEPILNIQKIDGGWFHSDKEIETIIGYRYSVGMQLALCCGRIDSIKEIWIGEKQLWTGTAQDAGIYVNNENLFGGEEFGSGGISGWIRVHSGSTSQSANGYLSRWCKVGGVTPAYRGIAYIVFEGGYIGTSQSIQPWEVYVRRHPAQLSGTYKSIGTTEANPIHVAYEIFTQYLGFPTSSINWSNWYSAAQTLYNESNGFSINIDNPYEGIDIIKLIEDQIDGVFVLNNSTGLWEVNLIRGGYTLSNEPQIEDENTIEVKEFTRGGWEDTTNEIRLEFTNKNDRYQKTYAIAQDPANIKIQLGRVVSATVRMPGVKVPWLASQLAFRELRQRSYPLAKATVVVTREFWNLQVGDVVSFSNTLHGVENQAMRVQKIDTGNLSNSEIILDLIQDVFTIADSSFEINDNTLWDVQYEDLVAIPATEQIAFEAPLGFTRRGGVAEYARTVWCAGRSQGVGETKLNMVQRNGATSTFGSYYAAGSLYSLILIGTLSTDVPRRGYNYTFTVNTAGWDDVAKILRYMAPVDLGTAGDLCTNLIMVDDELMIVTNPTDSSGNLSCGLVYRGVMDTAVKPHSSGTKVYMIHTGGGLLGVSFTYPRKIDVKLLPENRYGTLAEASATAMTVTLDNRNLRPYPVNGIRFNNSSTWYQTTNVHMGYPVSSTEDGYGTRCQYHRRDYRNWDEIVNITTDAATIDSSFPAADTTQYQMKVYKDPSGTEVLLYTSAWNSGENYIDVLRNDLMAANGGLEPTECRFEFFVRHTKNSVVYTGTQPADHVVNMTTTYDTWFNLGALDDSDVSNSYTAPDTGSYTCNTVRVLPSGIVEYRINGGTWTATGITTSSASGTIPGVTATDTIEVRHTGTTGSQKNLFKIIAPTTSPNAIGVLIF
jgi:hypothetical protein